MHHGSSSFLGQSFQAAEVARSVVYYENSHQILAIESAFSNLDILSHPPNMRYSIDDYSFANAAAGGDISDLDLLPTEFVIEILRKVKGITSQNRMMMWFNG
jgi:hypothetical protein